MGGGKKKTEPARGMNPTYNKSLTYTLSPAEMSEIFTYVLYVSIWQKTGSIVKDNFGICDAVIPLNSLQDIRPNAEKFIERAGTFKMFSMNA